MRRLYVVNFDCPHCGKVHVVTAGLVLAPGPDRAGTMAELWPDGNYPARLLYLVGDVVWCDAVGRYVTMEPERLTVIPPGGFDDKKD